VTPEEAAAHEAQVDQQLRDLATQIAQQAKLGFDPTTIRKGIITGVSEGPPPTVSINLSGDTGTLISEVATLNNYTPLVGQTVLVAKQGTEIFLLGSIAAVVPRSVSGSSSSTDGWVKATLTNGTHGGNDNDVYYRRIMDNGSWKMQWRGVWNPGGQTFMINTADALDTDYRPTSYRALAAARDVTSSTDRLATVRMDFAADGTIRYYSAAPALDINPSSPGTSDNGSHAHGYFDDWDGVGSGSNDTTNSGGSHSHTVDSHYHGGSISVAAPTWISLNGLEYFL
jgi:hypothetical protein